MLNNLGTGGACVKHYAGLWRVPPEGKSGGPVYHWAAWLEFTCRGGWEEMPANQGVQSRGLVWQQSRSRNDIKSRTARDEPPGSRGFTVHRLRRSSRCRARAANRRPRPRPRPAAQRRTAPPSLPTPVVPGGAWSGGRAPSSVSVPTGW
jgi:hypothetical protein